MMRITGMGRSEVTRPGGFFFFLLTSVCLRHTIPPNKIAKNADEDEYASKRFPESLIEVV
jgi:hypothetical protein